ncbi:metal-sensing transcriptional repressor [Tepidibacter aestuarii]|uniref:metal-sensing transcriptional repressor n=1 Tax=Tepidibacter aestuarii TaxID=2925782 RepID=UPI002ED682CD|nr:Copper-sensing transcriptional repressor CsoR [Tepidibacter aestuarii]
MEVLLLDKNQEVAVHNLKTARGQIDGILKMIEDERYCIDISNQIISAQSLLKKANLTILKNHLNSCIKNSFKDDEYEKIEEVSKIIERIIGK